MDVQNNSLKNLPKKSEVGNQKLIGIALLVGFAAIAGLIYTNVLLIKSSKDIKNLNSSVSGLAKSTAKLEEISKKGASDELLGFDKVDKSGFQSVFLSSNQVYFGKITSMTTENFVLENVYYLKVNGSDQSLVKLGCELHKPEDKLIIVRNNVQFWENLKDNDKNHVTDAIRDYEKQNPDGQKCA